MTDTYIVAILRVIAKTFELYFFGQVPTIDFVAIFVVTIKNDATTFHVDNHETIQKKQCHVSVLGLINKLLV
jgi:hypothetical protein